ncbi:MAG: hypothetical protein ACFNOP_07370, partial [Bacteroides sp.]
VGRLAMDIMIGRDRSQRIATSLQEQVRLPRSYHRLGRFTYRAPFPMLVIQDTIAKFAVVRFIR